MFTTPRSLEDKIDDVIFRSNARQYNQVKLSLLNFTEFIRELRLCDRANGIQSAINRE